MLGRNGYLAAINAKAARKAKEGLRTVAGSMRAKNARNALRGNYEGFRGMPQDIGCTCEVGRFTCRQCLTAGMLIAPAVHYQAPKPSPCAVERLAKTLRIVGKGQWKAPGATVTHEKVDGFGWSYVVRWEGASDGAATICETLDDAMTEVGCDKVEIAGRQAAELARD